MHRFFVDDQFATSQDSSVAMIMAYDMLIVYLQQEIEKLESNNNYNQNSMKQSSSKLFWTGNKTELIELIYALHSSGAIHSGTADIKELACRTIVLNFNHLGFKTIEDYGNTKSFCFDDLGIESPGRFYGKDLNVMGELLLSRYDLYLQSKRRTKTHATTNFGADELEEFYGNRVRSRMRELFNLIAFDEGVGDKRK
ncbi:RteC domain-containing protein [Gelidibacter salicanalis]|uniref:RteC domain-containing protein n=1 Tax=Gelidibacter salicanalis TaxID=291193 RepID=UPI0027DE189A|nr:RteC domain-containing protein [Gelidibacter salicanalis]